MPLRFVTTITFSNIPYVISINFSLHFVSEVESLYGHSPALTLTNKNTLLYLSSWASFCPFCWGSTSRVVISVTKILLCTNNMRTSRSFMVWGESQFQIQMILSLSLLILLSCVVSSSTTAVPFLVIVVSPVYESSWVLVNQ